MEELEMLELEKFSDELAHSSYRLSDLCSYVKKELSEWIEKNAQGILKITGSGIFLDFESDYMKVTSSKELGLEKFLTDFSRCFNRLIDVWVKYNWSDKDKRNECYLGFTLEDTIAYLYESLREEYKIDWIEQCIKDFLAYEAIR